MQLTLPLALAHALTDSPVGAMSWIYQILYQIGDQNCTETEIITRTLMLYIPGLYRNIRAYKGMFKGPNFVPAQNKTVPTSVLQFGGSNHYPVLASLNYAVISISPLYLYFFSKPREWVERTASVTYFARHDRGAHFPAESAPDFVVEDIRDIFS